MSKRLADVQRGGQGQSPGRACELPGAAGQAKALRLDQQSPWAQSPGLSMQLPRPSAPQLPFSGTQGLLAQVRMPGRWAGGWKAGSSPVPSEHGSSSLTPS